MTEKRVIEANHAISLAYSEHGAEDKKQAAEFLSQQVYALYEERRQLLADKETLESSATELQRANVALMVEVERYRSLMGDVHSQSKVVQLVHRVEELQDLLVQQRQTTDVSVIVDAHAQIRALNVELAKKTKLIDDLKSKVQHFTAKRNAKDIGQDEDVVEYLVNMVKEKEKTVEELSYKVKQLLVRLCV